MFVRLKNESVQKSFELKRCFSRSSAKGHSQGWNKKRFGASVREIHGGYHFATLEMRSMDEVGRGGIEEPIIKIDRRNWHSFVLPRLVIRAGVRDPWHPASSNEA